MYKSLKYFSSMVKLLNSWKKCNSILSYRNSGSWKRRQVQRWDLSIILFSGFSSFMVISLLTVLSMFIIPQAKALAGRVQQSDGELTVDKQENVLDICNSTECIDTASMVLKNMNPEVKPCDNFYQYACGGFLKNTIIPDDNVKVNTFTVLRDELQEQMRKIIEAESKPNEKKPFRLVKNLYKACMNKTAIEEQGLKPLYKILKKLGGWPILDGDSWNEDEFDWRTTIYKLRDIGYFIDQFIDFKIIVDEKNNTRHIIELDEASLGLSREYLLKGLDDEIVKAYYSYMVDIAQILGANKTRAITELKESLMFEMQLANISLPKEKRRNATQMYNPMTLVELTKICPSVPWKEYFSRLLPSSIVIDDNESVIVAVPRFFKDLETLMATTPKKVQANYVMWSVAVSSVILLNEDIRKRQLQYLTEVSGQSKGKPRWKECVNVVSDIFGHSVGAMYVREYFKGDAKNNAVKMVTDIREQFTNILNEVNWMDNKTRKSALKKAAAMTSHIAYPDELLDDNKLEELYEKLELSSENYFESSLNLSLFGIQYSFENLRKPFKKNDWVNHGMPVVANAFYSSIENSIQLPAGILQKAFFNNDRPRYMNYGAIGSIIGHEITHGFDDRGRQFDKDGNLVDWWATATKDNYLQRAKCIIDQYGNYTVKEVGLNLNGINTQGENIADNGGIKEAYLAYNSWVEKRGRPEPRLPGLENLTPRQMFWISVANAGCSKVRPKSLKLHMRTSVHSPEEFRVLGPLSNMPEFSKDFECSLGTKMNPIKKCTVW